MDLDDCMIVISSSFFGWVVLINLISYLLLTSPSYINIASSIRLLVLLVLAVLIYQTPYDC